jgi:preprotein translocase subunit YajC
MDSPNGSSVLVATDTPAASPGPQAGFLSTLPLLVAIGAIFYFVLIRPQQKQVKEHHALLNALQKDDMVVTAAGIYGRISAVKNDTVTLEIARDVRIIVSKESVRKKLTPDAVDAALSDKPAEKVEKPGRKGT